MTTRTDRNQVFLNGEVVSEETVETDITEETNQRTIEEQAQTALGNNRTYLALGSPTAAQNLAQIRALTRQNNGIIRLLLNQLDGTD